MVLLTVAVIAIIGRYANEAVHRVTRQDPDQPPPRSNVRPDRGRVTRDHDGYSVKAARRASVTLRHDTSAVIV
jgi:hypothetical protein